MKVQLCDVRGDGHCYYRCVWQVAQQDACASKALYLTETDETEETQGALEVRYFVVMSLRNDSNAIDVLRRLLVLADETTDQETLSALKESYPILGEFSRDKSFDTVLTRVRDQIEHTNIYASSFEHEIVKTKLSLDADLCILVLCKAIGDENEDIADKWLRQLHKQLQHVTESRVAVIINCDNLHYMYLKWRCNDMGVVLSTRDLHEYVNTMMSLDSDSE